MGGHNRPYPSLEWVGVDREQIVWKNGSSDVRVEAVARGIFRSPLDRFSGPADQWEAMEHLYLNLAACRTEDLLDPPDVLARIAKELIQSAMQKQSVVTARGWQYVLILLL